MSKNLFQNIAKDPILIVFDTPRGRYRIVFRSKYYMQVYKNYSGEWVFQKSLRKKITRRMMLPKIEDFFYNDYTIDHFESEIPSDSTGQLLI
jgi:hypothetical protein